MNWKTTPQEHDLISKITSRAAEMAEDNGVKYDRLCISMDVHAAHCNGCPLDLQALLDAPDSDFGHDVFGISRHIDRSTGKLLNCFVPRYAAKQSQAA